MNSHEYAKQLKDTAERMLSKPVFDFEEYATPHVYTSFWNKEKFVAAARALGSGKKEFSSDDLHFMPTGTCLILTIGRDKVCRKVQDVKWECEPLFSGEEIEQLGEQEEQVF